MIYSSTIIIKSSFSKMKRSADCHYWMNGNDQVVDSFLVSITRGQSGWIKRVVQTFQLVCCAIGEPLKRKEALVLNVQLIWHRNMRNAMHRSYTVVKMADSTKGSLRLMCHCGYERRPCSCNKLSLPAVGALLADDLLADNGSVIKSVTMAARCFHVRF